MFDLPARPDDADQLAAFVSWAGATADALGLDPFPFQSVDEAIRNRNRRMIADHMGESRRDGYDWYADPYPITFAAAVDAGDDVSGPLADWVAATRSLAAGARGGARRTAERAAEHAGPAALAQGQALWDAANDYRQRAAATSTTRAATAADRSPSWV